MKKNQCLFQAPQEVMDELKSINDRVQEKGYALKKDAERHLELSQQYQICNTCRRPYREIGMGMMATVPGYNGKEYKFCFSPSCMHCEMVSWMMDPNINS